MQPAVSGNLSTLGGVGLRRTAWLRIPPRATHPRLTPPPLDPCIYPHRKLSVSPNDAPKSPCHSGKMPFARAGAPSAAGGGRKRSRAAAQDLPSLSSSEQDHIAEAGADTPATGARSPPPPLSPEDTRGIAEALFLHSKPQLSSVWEAHTRAVDERLEAVVERKIADIVDPAGAMASMVRCLVREELDASAERRPQVDNVLGNVVKEVRDTVVQAIRTTPQMRTADQMTKTEVNAAISTAVGYKKIRDLLPEVLSRRITAIFKDDASDIRDVSTISFPAASKKRKSYANIEFDKVVKSLVHKLYEQNALKPKNERHAVLRNKERLLLHDMDMVDDLICAAARVALHDGRSEARKLFFRLFAFFLMTPHASMELEHPEANPPSTGAGASSAYYAVVTRLRASEDGDVGAEAETHDIKRTACLHDVAAQLLQAIVLQPYPFDAAVVDAVASNLRGVVTSADRSWTKMSMKDAEAASGPGSWGLMLPMMDCRKTLAVEVQTLKPSEKYALRTTPAPDTSVSAGTGSAPDRSASDSTSTAPRQPSWL